jgi:hypothetical protein
MSVIRFLVRSLLVFVALASPALAQDGSQGAAAAKEAVVALQSYLDQVVRAGGRPDYMAPPASELLPRIFDLARLEVAAPPRAEDLVWLIDWFGAANRANKLIIGFGMKSPDKLTAADQAAVARNLEEDEDQYAMALNFLLRLSARLDVAGVLFMEHLPPEQRTPIRLAGQQKARHGGAEIIFAFLNCIRQAMKPANMRLVSGTLRDTRDVWANAFSAADRASLLKALATAQETATDVEAKENLAAFGEALMAVN